jgi:hypothetical protein
MRYIFLFGIICMLGISCQKQDFIDTGKANGEFDGSMMDYLRSDSYNWDSTVLVIERAGLEDLFEGNDPENAEITFLGCTNLSILRWMLEEEWVWNDETGGFDIKPAYHKVADIPVEDCREMILRHVIQGKYLKADIPKGISNPKEGGKDFSTLGDNSLWLYTYTDPWNGVPDKGPTHLYVESYTAESKIDVASSDIRCDNGVVHSLHYNYIFGDI